MFSQTEGGRGNYNYLKKEKKKGGGYHSLELKNDFSTGIFFKPLENRPFYNHKNSVRHLPENVPNLELWHSDLKSFASKELMKTLRARCLVGSTQSVCKGAYFGCCVHTVYMSRRFTLKTQWVLTAVKLGNSTRAPEASQHSKAIWISLPAENEGGQGWLC